MTRLARSFTAVCTAGITALGLTGAACADDFPTKPIRIVIGIAPGGGLDAMSRLGAQKLTERWGQSVIVDNRPGGGTVIAMDMVAQAPADGYTLLGASETLMLNGVLKRARYDVRKAFIPIVRLSSQSYVLAVTASLPVKNVKELVAYAKAKPGTLSYGSQGLGTQGHIGMERFKAVAGIDMVHVPYKGSALSLIDVLSGQIQLTFASTVASSPHIKSGKLKGLAVTGAKRSPAYPDIPTVIESGVPFELTNSYSYYAPARTSMGVVRAINAVVSHGMNAPETVKLLAADGSEPAPPLTPEEFKAKFAKDYVELERLLAAIHLKLN
ncbi:MAG TPA: tripartite tricarboxylate transporter substrate binding protein [Burkholderiales bacterium]|nr:tripartite tricarboxylate transporter substrate binding protein [Burkholderiales bacterium]